MKRLSLLIIFAFFLRVGLRAQVNIILDTDMGSDCDDAGALAILNQLEDKGEAKILGVIYSSGKNKYGVGVCDAINVYYGHGNIPLGQYEGDNIGDPRDHYSKEIATNPEIYHNKVVDSTTGLVKAYRTILRNQSDSSVTIVTIGHPYGLVMLLRNPITFSLIKKKVEEWIAMTYTGTIPKRDWNFGRNGVQYYIHTLLKNWPTKVYFCGLGANIITGNKKLPLTPFYNPVRKAYKLWNNAIVTGRPSWDPITVLFAVRPQYFKIDSIGSLEQNDKFQTFWNKKINNPKQFKVISSKLNNSVLQNMIEDLMSEPPFKNDTKENNY